MTAVMQDIEAKVLTKNIARLVSLGAETPLAKINDRRKLIYQINFKQTLSKCKHTLVKGILMGELRQYVDYLIAMTMKYIEPIRKGRQYPRKRLVGTRSATHGTYKGVR